MSRAKQPNSLIIGVFLAGLALGSCATGGPVVSVSNDDYAVSYDLQEIRAATEHADIQVTVVGPALFGLGKDESARRIVSLMQPEGSRSWPYFNLQETAKPDRPINRVVLVFYPANDLQAKRVCDGETGSKPARPNQIIVFAVLCRGGQPMAQALGVTGLTGSADRAVAQLLRQVVLVLFNNAPIIEPSHGYPGGLL